MTRKNTFVFRNLPSPSPSDSTSCSDVSSPATSEAAGTIGTVSYLLDIACRDYDFLSYGVDVKSDGAVLVYRVSRGGIAVGEKVMVGEEPVEVRVLRSRDYYEARAGCMSFAPVFMKLREKGRKGSDTLEFGQVKGME